MRTEQQIRDAALTVTANRSFGGTLAAELIALMVATGMINNKRGWIYWTMSGAPGKPIAHGWGQMIASLTRHSWNGRDLVAEMSKRSVTEQDVRAAEREAYVMAEAPAGSAHGRPDTRGMNMGPGHVAPATIERAFGEVVSEQAERERGIDQRRDFYREVSARIRGSHSAQAERYARRQLIAELHEQAIAEDAERAERDKTIAVTFERLGRSRDLVTRIDRVYLDDVDEFARQMHAFARTRVASRHFEVEIDVERGVVLVEGGRFGRGTFPVPAAPTPAEPEPRDPYLAQFPTPRADRLAAGFEQFNRRADSGGPGTARGVIAACESVSTVTPEQLTVAIAEAGIPRHSLTALDVGRVIELLGFAISE